MSKPSLPEFGSGFKSLSDKAKELWVKVRLVTEAKDPVTTMVSRSTAVNEAIAAYIKASEDIKALDKIKEDARKVIFDALVKNSAMRVETDNGYAFVEASTQTVYDKDFLMEKFPDAFGVVPAALKLIVKPNVS
jgi:hypothetical protein